VWLLAVWIALWGNLSVANIVSGVLVVAGVAVVFAGVGPRPASGVQLVGVLRFIGFFCSALVVSNIEVVGKVLGSQPVRPGIIAFTMRDVSDAVVTLVADAITLTPGTLTLDIRSDGEHAVLYVHVLDLDEEESVRADLDELQRLALAAFGGRAERGHREDAPA
jgi:multicomponent Na+:H+ antiporter subunit E